MIPYNLVKIGEFMKKFLRNIIVDLILFDLLFGITCLIVDKLGLEYLKWVKQTVLIINCIGSILGIIQLILKIERKPERIIIIILVIVNLLIFNRVIIGVIAFVYYLYPPEYIAEIENQKMVGYVINGYETKVDYYRYKNIFTREKNRVYEENYGKGTFNPFKEKHSALTYYYYDEEGKLEKRIDTIEESENLEENKQKEDSESAILYEKKINENISIRVRRECFILAQRCVITIQKTIDGGSTWNTESGGITINNGAEFIFIDENIGFINDY